MSVNADDAGLAKSPRWTRRSTLQLAAIAAGSPLLAQTPEAARPPRPQRIYPPTYSDEVMAPVNVNEMEDIARQKIPPEWPMITSLAAVLASRHCKPIGKRSSMSRFGGAWAWMSVRSTPP